jgi:hypothetical protein
MPKHEVVELRYRVAGVGLQFDAPKPLAIDNEFGSFLLANNVLRVRPQHRSSLTEVRAETEGFLRAWEFEAELRYGAPTITFEYLDAEGVGESFNDGRGEVIRAAAPEEAEAGDSLVIVMGKYPEPPSMRLTPEIEEMWSRFRRGGLIEPIQSCAYYCLTVVERSAGGRMAAAKRYNIDPPVLKKLGELTSASGDPKTARKALAPGSSPLTRAEERWIGYAIKLIVFQMGVVAAGAEPDRLNLAVLPALGA